MAPGGDIMCRALETALGFSPVAVLRDVHQTLPVGRSGDESWRKLRARLEAIDQLQRDCAQVPELIGELGAGRRRIVALGHRLDGLAKRRLSEHDDVSRYLDARCLAAEAEHVAQTLFTKYWEWRPKLGRQSYAGYRSHIVEATLPDEALLSALDDAASAIQEVRAIADTVAQKARELGASLQSWRAQTVASPELVHAAERVLRTTMTNDRVTRADHLAALDTGRLMNRVRGLFASDAENDLRRRRAFVENALEIETQARVSAVTR